MQTFIQIPSNPNMTETKAVKILKTLTKEEFKNFGKFAASPYYNSRNEVVKLFNIIKKYYPDFANRNIEIKTVYKKLYPSEKYHEGKIRNAISDLGLLAEKFITIEAFSKDDFEVNYYKITDLKKRNIEKLHEKLIDRTLAGYDEMTNPLPGNISKIIELFDVKINYYRENFKISKQADLISKRNQYSALAGIKTAVESKRASMIDLHNYNIDCENLSANLFDSIDFDKFFKAIKDKNSKAYKILQLEYYLHKVFVGKDNYETNLKKFHAIFTALKPSLDKKYLYNILITLDGAYTNQFNLSQGHTVSAVMDRIIDNYDTILNEKLYKLEQDYFPPYFFRNICDLAVSGLRLDWCESFVKKYGPELPEEHRQNLMYYPLGAVCFKKGKFEEALKYFSGITKSNFISQWQMKVELASTHYELGNYETALSVTDAFLAELGRKYTNHKELSKNTAFLSSYLFKKLIKVAAGANNEGLEELIIEMNTTPGFRLKPDGWFTKKLNELKSRK